MVINILQIVLQFLLKNVLDHLWPFFFTMQSVKCLLLYKGYLPANVEVFLENVRKMVDFEYLNAGVIMAYIQDKKVYIKNELYQKAGIREDNFFVNISQYLVFIGFAMFLLLIVGIVMIFKKALREKIKVKLIEIYKNTVWNGWIRTLYISYIANCIQANVQRDKANLYYTIFVLLVPFYLFIFVGSKPASILDLQL